MKSNSLFFFNGIFALTCSPIIAYAFFYRWEIRFINGALHFVDKPAWAFSVNLISSIFLVCSILAIFIYRKESNGRKKSFLFLLVASITGFIPFLSFFSAIFALIAGILYLVDFNRLVKKSTRKYFSFPLNTTFLYNRLFQSPIRPSSLFCDFII